MDNIDEEIAVKEKALIELKRQTERLEQDLEVLRQSKRRHQSSIIDLTGGEEEEEKPSAETLESQVRSFFRLYGYKSGKKVYEVIKSSTRVDAPWCKGLRDVEASEIESKRRFKALKDFLIHWYTTNKGKDPLPHMIQDALDYRAPNTKREPIWTTYVFPLYRFNNQICASCDLPIPRGRLCYGCGANCGTGIIYCGQDCADAHWEEHNCRK